MARAPGWEITAWETATREERDELPANSKKTGRLPSPPVLQLPPLSLPKATAEPHTPSPAQNLRWLPVSHCITSNLLGLAFIKPNVTAP